MVNYHFKGKKRDLFNWCIIKGQFNSVDVLRWGLDNFYKSADRRVREFAADPDIPIQSVEGDSKIAQYQVVNTDKTGQLIFI